MVRTLALGTFLCLVIVSRGQGDQAYRDSLRIAAEINMRSSSAPADLVVANRNIITLRSEVAGNTPVQRVANISKRLEDAIADSSTSNLRDSALYGGRIVLLNGKPVFYVSTMDVDPSLGEDVQLATAHAIERLRVALDELHELRDTRRMSRNIGYALLYTGLLVLVLWALRRIRRWLHTKTEAFLHHHMDRSGIAGGLSRGLTAYLIAQRLAMVLIGGVMLIVLYTWATAVLRRIPLTRVWGEGMSDAILDVGLWLVNGILDALPGLAMVAFIFVIARTVVRIISRVFDRVHRGELEVTWMDAAIAQPTKRVVVLLLWIFALVIAYPYIPGSNSRAFQGVSVLAGVMLSLGSSGVISQAMSGLALMFNRLMRVGEVVSIGDLVTGTVKQIGYFNSTIVTSYGEEVTVPNSTIMANKITNLSRHPGGKGILWTTGVTIGYDSPWRQVQAMLLEAARMTNGLAVDPPPKVAQHALNDFYVDYRLTVVVTGPFRPTLTDLHANIQDVFNTNGVQIMSPHYEQDPGQAKVVPKEQWDPGISKS